jgi:putative essential recombination function protein
MKKLTEIQSTLKAPKGNFNNFGKYKYRSCEDILEALKPLLAELSCVVTLSDEIVQIGERYYIKATATLLDCESGETQSTTAFAREELEKKGMDSSQITGSASSYARKYALNGLFAIDDGVDADKTNTHGKKAEPATLDQVFPNKPVFDSDKFASFKTWTEGKSKDEVIAKINEIKEKYSLSDVMVMDLEEFSS